MPGYSVPLFTIMRASSGVSVLYSDGSFATFIGSVSVVRLIFTLVLTIALFNVVGSIIVMILDKRENIKTLYSLGATPNQIKNIFFLQGMLMTCLGGILGLVVAIILIFLQMNFDLVMITPNLPYPVQMKVKNILIVIFTIFTLGLIASYIAAGRSKKALSQANS